ncbi:MAG: hypothetical protein A2161_17190 [Candidatus Schekmanbacteria bacterium RBG_13_48_7]|uniref:HTH cro/C1-type domain-containing protein n=1 Tax=Candidatus Schekmanbacteria bacterium RBG_13_48_7 TaxID=1817878 RepID=A0A1F7S2I9_9BACT|nr:MAG: hypothetical protein A2161_17190 [Candidatus Schekmanbacteria bacterium RBG_13_48_7]
MQITNSSYLRYPGQSLSRDNWAWMIDFAEILGISKSHLCDIEKGRKTVSPERAARFAEILGYAPDQFVRLSLQSMLDEAGLKMKVDIKAA